MKLEKLHLNVKNPNHRLLIPTEENLNQLPQAEIIQVREKKKTAVILHRGENHPLQVTKLREAVTVDHPQGHLPHRLLEAAEAAAAAQATGEDDHESA
jgi:hypothetical protein